MTHLNTGQAGYQKIFYKKWTLTVLLSAVLISAFTFSIYNAAGLRTALEQSTKSYLHDVTAQTANEIGDTMKTKMNELAVISDTVAQFHLHENPDDTTEFLKRKAALLEFDTLIIMDQNGNLLASNKDSQLSEHELTSLLELPGVSESFRGEIRAGYRDGQHIFYSAPVRRNSQIPELMIGTRKKENIQAMISSKQFHGHMLSCIVDGSGQVIISPTDLKPFLQLDSIFKSHKDSKVNKEIQNMLNDLAEKRSGSLKFTSIYDEQLVLSYNALGINDWFLLTIIPADIVTGGADPYIIRTFVIIGFTILLFSLFLYSIFRFYNDHRKQLERMAFTDPITEGLNNTAFHVKYNELSMHMIPGTYTIVLLNIIGFKLINEHFGVQAANRFLSYIYHVIQRHICLLDNEFAARSESDHFFLCLKEHDPSIVQMRLDQIIEDINAFHDTDLPVYHIAFKQGACLVDDPKLEITLLQDHARMAYQPLDFSVAQACAFFNDSITERMKMEHELNDMFDLSIENHDFQVYLQPKMSLISGTAQGAEALVRWNHPHKGMIAPVDFIPLFENNGKICRLDLYVFTEICSLLKKWKQDGKTLIPISVNLSRQHFRTPGFLEAFAAIAQKYEIPRRYIEFELTESIFFDHQQIHIVKKSIQQMHRLGFLCSLDDFGSGYSSLGLLKEFDVDTIKLDRSFFLNISGTRAWDIIACLVELSKRLDVQTVAEGIENQEHLDRLRRIDCDMVQGYIFSKPVPISIFEQLFP
ncbi:EAL domain-containing protein [Clostridium sp. AM58-1XD]|uniref:EAL domain-containing protein n=1 Tax=Clostridium sp. AM58-1XD TaxID=2292307 RepID=UPI000E515D4E|nr:EAL domain-containing protein [Clostridium sp. AM58-1XD]RGY98902.1 GGDEF domain-containing protein [Clostridium sp. AM58-1XD]